MLAIPRGPCEVLSQKQCSGSNGPGSEERPPGNALACPQRDRCYDGGGEVGADEKVEGSGTDELLELYRTVNEGIKGGYHVGPLTERDARGVSRGGEEGHVCGAVVVVSVVVGLLPSAKWESCF